MDDELTLLRLDNTRLERDCAALRAQASVISRASTAIHAENARLRAALPPETLAAIDFALAATGRH